MKKLYQTLCVLSVIASLICAPFATTTWRFGLWFFAMLAFCTGMMWVLIDRKNRTDTIGKIAKILVPLGNFVFLVWVLSFFVIEGMILSGLQSEPQEPVEVLFVLGGGLRGDQPTENLRNRLIVGMDAMEKYPEAQVIVCGGQGDDEDEPESAVMYRWMVEHGADAERIAQESESHNTIQNIENAKVICEANGWDTQHVTVVSSAFHLYRIRHIMNSCGMPPSVLGAPAGRLPARILMYIREYFSVLKLFISGYY